MAKATKGNGTARRARAARDLRAALADAKASDPRLDPVIQSLRRRDADPGARAAAILGHLEEAVGDLDRMAEFLADVANDQKDRYDGGRARMLSGAAEMHSAAMEWAIKQLRDLFPASEAA